MSDQKKKVALFVRMASRPVPRVQRGMKVADELGYEPIFCGAFRERGIERQGVWGGYKVERVGPMFPLLNGKRFFFYIVSVFRFQVAFFRYLFLLRPNLIHASDIETMPPAILYARLCKVRLVYNIHDNLAQRYNLPAAVNRALNFFEGLAVRCAHESLVPEQFRKDALPRWARRGVRVVRNTPQNVRFTEHKGLSGPIRLFYGGWLDWGRGLKELVSLAEKHPNIELRVAGEGSDEIVSFLKRHQRVQYLGYISHAESLEETQNCHIVPVFYRPNTVINRYAASNKMAEAFAIGRPILLNEELVVAEIFRGSAGVVLGQYGDTDGFLTRIDDLFSKPERYAESCEAARELYEQFYKWEVAHLEMRQILLGVRGPEENSK